MFSFSLRNILPRNAVLEHSKLLSPNDGVVELLVGASYVDIRSEGLSFSSKLIDGKYSETENIVAFTGGFPINKPEYVLTIVIDGPKPQKFSANRNTAGWVVAPIIGKLVNRIAPILKIEPLNLEPSQLGLTNYKIRGATL